MKGNNLLKFFLTRKINWVVIGYLFLGIFFVAAECGATNFWTIFLYVMSSYKFCLAFLYPTFILIFINFYQLLDSRDDIILRLKERTKYFKYYLKNSLMIIAYYMLVLLLLMGIAINLRGVSSYNLVLYKDYTNKFLPIPLIILIYHLIIISILVLISLKIIKNCNINIGFRK